MLLLLDQVKPIVANLRHTLRIEHHGPFRLWIVHILYHGSALRAKCAASIPLLAASYSYGHVWVAANQLISPGVRTNPSREESFVFPLPLFYVIIVSLLFPPYTYKFLQTTNRTEESDQEWCLMRC